MPEETEGPAGGANPLTRKLGPLPVWTWAAVIVGAAVAARYLKGRYGAASAPTSGQADLLDGSGSAPLTASPGAPLAGPAFANNAGWRNGSEAWLILTGVDPLTADSALTRFFGGQCLDAEELAAISLALQHYGPPPDGGQPAPTPCASVQAQPPVATPVATPPPPVSTGPIPSLTLATPGGTLLTDAQLAASRPTVPTASQPQGTQAPTATIDMYGRPAPGPGWYQSGGQWYPPTIQGGESGYSANFQLLGMDTHGNPVQWTAYQGLNGPPQVARPVIPAPPFHA